MEGSEVWTGRCVRHIDGRVYSAVVSVRAAPTDSDTTVALTLVADTELIRAFGPEAGYHAQAVRSGLAVQIACAPVAGEMPAVNRSRFRVEVVGIVPPEGAEREVAGFLLSVASMEAIAAYLRAFENQAARPAEPVAAPDPAPKAGPGR